MKDIMVDIETLSTKSNAVIVSISAVQFDLKSGEAGDSFEIGLNIEQQLNIGSHMSGSTVIWWLGQSKEAREQLLTLPRTGLGNALTQFNDWLASLGNVDDLRLWGNGVSFDNTIIRGLYERAGKKFVLPYWCDNDVRTLVNIFNIDTRDIPFEGTKHNGLDDCYHQIRYCTKGYADGN